MYCDHMKMGVFSLSKYGLYPEKNKQTPFRNVVQHHLMYSLISLVAQDTYHFT